MTIVRKRKFFSDLRKTINLLEQPNGLYRAPMTTSCDCWFYKEQISEYRSNSILIEEGTPIFVMDKFHDKTMDKHQDKYVILDVLYSGRRLFIRMVANSYALEPMK